MAGGSSAELKFWAIAQNKKPANPKSKTKNNAADFLFIKNFI